MMMHKIVENYMYLDHQSRPYFEKRGTNMVCGAFEKHRIAEWKITVVCILALCMVTLSGCAKKDKEKPKSISQIQQEQGIPVRVVPVSTGTVRAIEQKGSTVEGIYQTVLKNSMPGTIRSINAKVGNTVSMNAQLVTIDPDGGSPYSAAKSGFEFAENAYKRARELHKEGAVSQQDLEGARAQYEAAKRGLTQAKDAVTIRAPFNGTILEVYQTKNKKVGPGTELIKIARLDQLRMELDINESLIGKFKTGMRAYVVVGADSVWGEISKVALGASDITHSFPVTTIFKDKGSILRAGMYVTVNVIVEEHKDVLHVPIETVQFDEEKPYVYVVRGKKAVKTAVSTGIRNGSVFEILNGITADDKVVSNGISLLTDGASVKVVP
jgi:membrane fusion protein (multidrug efflux system)